MKYVIEAQIYYLFLIYENPERCLGEIGGARFGRSGMVCEEDASLRAMVFIDFGGF